MKIEIMEFGRVNQTGASLLRILQNNELPYLDLFIREGLQNSLDAHNNAKGNHVKVDINVGDFKSPSLSKKLDGITSKLDERYESDTKKFISIRDSNTFGLTGPMTAEEVKNGEYGNLISLVYSIAKPQTAEGSGGSWGYGKTAFYRMGIGLVIYYTRIETSYNSFQSRLVVAMAEDETSKNSIIPSFDNGPKQGMAWWGEEYKPNKTRPITDENEIDEVLSIFGIEKYQGKETGTTIIIPYIDEKRLLDHNKKSNSESRKNTPIWYRSVEDYVKMAVQRWYSPRLDNQLFYGGYLDFSFNGEKMTKNEMEPFYKIVQDLYNYGKHEHGVKEHLRNYNNIQYEREEVLISNDLETTLAGRIAYAKISKEQLEETSPNFRNNIYEMANIENNLTDKNRPIIAYARKPGMVVAYETSQSSWLGSVEASDYSEYIISFFVLNSENILKGIPTDEEKVITLDEYVKAGEEADHREWFDSTVENISFTILRRIKSNVERKLKAKYNFKVTTLEGEEKSLMSIRYGNILLPDSNFGSKASIKRAKPRVNVSSRRRKLRPEFKVINEEIEFGYQTISIPFEFDSKTVIKATSFELYVPSESGRIGADEFEKLTNLEYPSSIDGVHLDMYINDTNFKYSSSTFDEKNEIFRLSTKTTNKEKLFGLEFNFYEPSQVKITGMFRINILDKSTKQILSNEYEILQEADNE